MKARWPCQERLAECLAAHPMLAALNPSPVPRPASAGPEHVFCIGTEGAIVAGPNVAGRQMNDDEFTVNVRVITKRGGTFAKTQERLAELIGAIYDVVADGGIDGIPLVDWGVADDWEVHEVTPGSVTTSPLVDQDNEFPYAQADLGIDFEVRHYGGNR